MCIRLFFGILVFFSALFGGEFVFNEDSLFVQKSVDFVEQASSELRDKTGVNLYVYLGKSLNGATYEDFKADFITHLSAPFAAIILIRDDKKIDIATSNDDLLDKKKVYWEYMVPLIPQKDSELTPQALSAIVLNGYVESIDLIADSFGATIEHNFPKDEKGARAISQLILYVMLFSMLGIILLMYIFRKRGLKNE